MQSLTVLRAFAKHQRPRIGPPAAVAQVEVFGRVAGYAPDDDWQYTLRAEHARIIGPLYLRPGLPVVELSETYGVLALAAAGQRFDGRSPHGLQARVDLARLLSDW